MGPIYVREFLRVNPNWAVRQYQTAPRPSSCGVKRGTFDFPLCYLLLDKS